MKTDRKNNQNGFKHGQMLCPIFLIILCILLCACTGNRDLSVIPVPETENNITGTAINDRYLRFIGEEPNTMDPQCTSGYYTVALNVFDRLVEVETIDGVNVIVPALAESWEISDDGLVYMIHLRQGVTFSNGSPLTASDVKFTLERLLSNPAGRNKDIAMSILGAEAFRNGETETLEGLRIVDDNTIEITLAYPYGPFLACMSTPGASILDEETVTAAGEQSGMMSKSIIGTGPFVFEEWKPGAEITMKKNPTFWGKEAGCEGLRMIFLSGSVSPRLLFENGQVDILDLENVGGDSEYFINGDIYRGLIHSGTRVGITYIALNENIEPLNDVRVRKAMQLALDRNTIMRAIISGRGHVENGIFPHGLLGHNPDLPEIPYDVDEALKLLKEAGYPDGFDVNFCLIYNSSELMHQLVDVVTFMWSKIGIRTKITEMTEDEYIEARQRGELSCYTSTWSADFNDPDNFIYTFFGTPENTANRGLNYSNMDVIQRVQDARAIVDNDKRIAEYQDLEKKIIQEDAAWIPLYSAEHLFVVSERVEGFRVLWNGWSNNRYQNVSLKDSSL
ncbi:MAG: ABC transporter substrate-binding protein [Anaerolineaceae bacterium]|nr:ABC transporter substrate-binding protein [Anaerolineaceae bacterium]